MKIIFRILGVIFTSFFLMSCNAVSTKIDEKTSQEELELSGWLNQSEAELKINYGKPDKIDFMDNSKNRFYIYFSEKFKIKCERKFEINPSNMIIGFSSKNCF